jgi:mannose/fructose/N-acetylgalactosamine-specific phosphotransferase system component IIB
MPPVSRFRLVRVDDRLLHGQVALGWRHALDPKTFWIVDDAAAADPFAVAIFRGALPEGTDLVVHSIRAFLELNGLAEETAGGVLLLRGLADLRRLCDGGFMPEEVNLGGIHEHPGARRVLDYLFLAEEDRAAIRELLARGIRLYAQDLPGSRRRDVAQLLAEAG